MNKCKEGWPNKPSDVSPDAEEAFLAHVAGCPFHAKVLQADEEKIRSKCRLAQGLDGHGRILEGRELKDVIAKHDRSHTLWKRVALDTSLPFERIYLSNCGEDIAVSAKFFDFRKYEADHRLDPHAGLQIMGIIGEGKSTLEVFLGFYPLEGVKHTGEEQFLPLENNYTVGLRVKQLSEHDFNIGFRCVENEVLERERISATHHNDPASDRAANLLLRAITGTLKGLSSSFRRTTAKVRKRRSSSIKSEPVSFQETVTYGSAAFLITFLITFTISMLIWPDGSPQVKTAGVTSEVERKGDSRPANAKPNRRGRTSKSTQRKSDQTTVRSDEVLKPSQAGLTPQTGQEASSENIAAPNDKPPSSDSKPDTNAQPLDTAPAPWHFQSLPPATVSVEGIAVHSGSDPALAKKLTVEMRKRDINIGPFNVRILKAPHVAVAWSIIREQTAVTIKAKLTADGDRKVLTFRSDGNYPEQVCDEAVRTAVTGVIAVMQDLKQNEPANSEEF